MKRFNFWKKVSSFKLKKILVCMFITTLIVETHFKHTLWNFIILYVIFFCPVHNPSDFSGRSRMSSLEILNSDASVAGSLHKSSGSIQCFKKKHFKRSVILNIHGILLLCNFCLSFFYYQKTLCEN